MLRHVKDLSPKERRAVENLLGRPVAEDESVSIKGIRPSAIIPPRLSPDERKEAMESFVSIFAKVDRQRSPVGDAEEDEIINEALRFNTARLQAYPLRVVLDTTSSFEHTVGNQAKQGRLLDELLERDRRAGM
jgi:hypothetical protein